MGTMTAAEKAADEKKWADFNFQQGINKKPDTANNNNSSSSSSGGATSTAIDFNNVNFGGRINNEFSRQWYRDHNGWNGYDAYMVALMGQQNTTDANKVVTPPVTTNTGTGTSTGTGTGAVTGPVQKYIKLSAPIAYNGTNIPAGSVVAAFDDGITLDLTKPYTLPSDGGNAGASRQGIPNAPPMTAPGGSTTTAGAGTGGGNGAGDGNSTIPMTPADTNAIAATITATQNAAIAAANAYGYMVKPTYNNVGNIIAWEPVLDTSGNRIPTLTAGQPAAQIALYNAQAAKEAASAIESYAKAYGKVKDPQTGEWVATSDKLVADTTRELNLANARRLDEQTKTENRNFLAQALGDPNRFVEAFGLAQLQGARAGGTAAQPGGLWGQAQQYLSQLPAGTQSVMAKAAVPGAISTQSYGANGQPLIALNDNPVDTTSQLTNLAQNTLLPVSGNLNAALTGQYVPTLGNASGSQGQVQSLASVLPAYGNFAKISPVVFRNLDTATQGQYGSLAQSIQGINAADLKQRVNAQLPGSSGGIPSAFRL